MFGKEKAMGASAWRRLGAILFVVALLVMAAVPTALAGRPEAPVASASASAGASVGSDHQLYSAGGTSCRTIYHRVVRGENLTRIAYRYGVTVRQLVLWNHILNPDKIYAGRVLVVYKCTYVPPPPPPPPTCVACPPPPPPTQCWRAEFYNDVNLGGPVAQSACYQTIAFTWGWDAPAPGVNADYFSARFTNSIYLAAGQWRITVRADDGVRVYIDDVLVINDWRIQAPTTDWQDVLIQTSGQHTFRVEYFENDQHAEVYLWCQKVN